MARSLAPLLRVRPALVVPVWAGCSILLSTVPSTGGRAKQFSMARARHRLALDHPRRQETAELGMAFLSRGHRRLAAMALGGR
jgi:hypothetical protein